MQPVAKFVTWTFRLWQTSAKFRVPITFVRNAIVVTKIESGFFYRTSRRGRDVGAYWGRNHQDCNESRFHASSELDSAEVGLAARRSKQGGRGRGRSEQS